MTNSYLKVKFRESITGTTVPLQLALNFSSVFVTRFFIYRGNVGRDKRSVATDNSVNPYPTAFPYGNGMVLHFYQQQESSTTKTVHKVINKRLKTYV